MLTKRDLEDIGELVDHRLDKRFAEQRVETNERFKSIDDQFKKQESNLDKKLKPINRKLNKIQKDLSATIEFFDDDVTDLKVRMDRVETRLQLPTVVAN